MPHRMTSSVRHKAIEVHYYYYLDMLIVNKFLTTVIAHMLRNTAAFDLQTMCFFFSEEERRRGGNGRRAVR